MYFHIYQLNMLFIFIYWWLNQLYLPMYAKDLVMDKHRKHKKEILWIVIIYSFIHLLMKQQQSTSITIII